MVSAMTESDQTEPLTRSAPMMSTSIGKLAEALAKAQGMMTGAIKDSKNPFFKSNYADLNSVWEAIREPLSRNGLSIIQTMETLQNGLCIVTILAHSSGEWVRSETPIKSKDDTAQSMGSGTTYARRYALAAIAGIAQMDDDGEAAMGRKQLVDNTKTPRQSWIDKAAKIYREELTADKDEPDYKKMQDIDAKLSSDEHIAVLDSFGSEICPGTKRQFKNIIADCLKRKPADNEPVEEQVA